MPTPSTVHVSFDGTARSRSSLSPFTSKQNHSKTSRRYSEETFSPLFEEIENEDRAKEVLFHSSHYSEFPQQQVSSEKMNVYHFVSKE